MFNLIIVRVGLGLSRGPGRSSGTAEPMSTVRFPLQNLSISVSQHVSVSRDVERLGSSMVDGMHLGSTMVDGKDDFSDKEVGWKDDSICAVAM